MTDERRALLRTVTPISAALLLAIIALALHPQMSGHAAAQAQLREIGTLRVRDELVHGTLLVLLGALLTGFASYALRRGLTRLPVVAGLVTFAIAIGALVVAGLLDGFIVPEIAGRFVSAPPAAQDAAIATFTALFVAVNMFSSFAIVAMATAIGAWSLDLARDSGEGRTAGIAGFVSAALTVAVLVTNGPFLLPHTLIAVFCVQGVWYVWLAVLIARGRA